MLGVENKHKVSDECSLISCNALINVFEDV